VQCQFAREVCSEALILSNGNNKWEKDSLKRCFECWYSDKTVKAHRALPCFVLWDLYLSRNQMIFQGKVLTPKEMSHKIIYGYSGAWTGISSSGSVENYSSERN
jgi:hypothetical protein